MTIHNLLSSNVTYRLGWTLVHSLWEGAAIAAIVAVILCLLPRRPGQTRYVALMMALLAIVAGSAITFIVGPDSTAPTAVAGRSPNQRAWTSNSERGIALFSSSAGAPGPLILSPSQPGAWSALANKLQRALPSIARVWIAGVLLLAIWRAGGWLGAQRLRVIKTERADARLLAVAQRLAERLDLSRSFDVLISRLAQTPMVIGWLRPVILLPAAAISGLAPWQLEGILAHELAHIRRHDYFVNLLQILVETLLFYHPAVWWLSRKIRLEREQACDDAAVGLCGDRCQYAQSLAALEELRWAGSVALAARGSGGRQLIARIRRILSPTDHAPRWGLASMVLILALATSAAVLYSQTAPSTQPFTLRNNARRLSPFTAVRWRGELPEVQYQGTWYELSAINDVPAAAILDYLKRSGDFAPKKHFAEDLVEVMAQWGHPVRDAVKLNLKTLDTSNAITIPAAPMTEENRRAVLMNDNVVSDGGRALRGPLGKSVGPLRASGTSLVDVIDQLSQATGQNILVNWTALGEAHVTKYLPVTIDLSNQSLGDALTALLNEVGGTHVRLGYSVERGYIAITTFAELSKDIVTRVYDARAAVKSGRDLAQIIRRVRGIDPLSWREQPGDTDRDGYDTIDESNGELIVTQTREVQERIAVELRDVLPPDKADEAPDLQSWGRIQGRVMIGTKPGAGIKLQAWSLDQVNAYGSGLASVVNRAETDVNGNFTMDRVVPGTIEIARDFPQQSGNHSMDFFGPLASVHVAAGQTTTVKLGGVGRPVVGKFIFPPTLDPADYFINARAILTGGTDAMPAAYFLQVDEQHNFRIDDVPPGDYRIHIFVQNVGGERTSQQEGLKFTMPDVPGGVSDEPLAIPNIRLQ